jgi:glutamate 5-kinase
VGITDVIGPFRSGNAVDVQTGASRVIARGLVRMDSAELARISGRRGGAEAIHRDDLVVFAPD